MHCDGGIYSLHTAGIPQLLKEKKSPSHGIQKVNYIEFQLDKSGKYITPMSNILYLVFHSQEATCHTLE